MTEVWYSDLQYQQTLHGTKNTGIIILSSWYETGSKHVTSAKMSSTKSSWKPIAAGAPPRSILGLVLFNTLINDLEDGAANPQQAGRSDKTGRGGWDPLVYFCHPQHTLTGVTSGLTETSWCPDIFRKFPRTWQPLWRACASAPSLSTGKMYFLTLRGSLLCSSLCPLPLVQSLGATKNNLTPSPSPCCFRCFLTDTHWPLQGSFCKDRFKKSADGKHRRSDVENSQGFLYTGRE